MTTIKVSKFGIAAILGLLFVGATAYAQSRLEITGKSAVLDEKTGAIVLKDAEVKTKSGATISSATARTTMDGNRVELSGPVEIQDGDLRATASDSEFDPNTQSLSAATIQVADKVPESAAKPE